MTIETQTTDFREIRRDWVFWFATAFGSGLMKPAPGTWGSLFGLGLGILLIETGLTDGAELFAWTVAITILAIYKLPSLLTQTGGHDHGEIVIDEIAGQWLALLPLIGEGSWLGYLYAFLFFRLFDILKPGPIGWLDRKLTGSVGIMADDLLAGAVSAGILWMMLTYFPYLL